MNVSILLLAIAAPADFGDDVFGVMHVQRTSQVALNARDHNEFAAVVGAMARLSGLLEAI